MPLIQTPGLSGIRGAALGSFSTAWSVTFNSNDSGAEDDSYRNLMSPSVSGDVCRITCAASTSAALNCDNLSIMQHSGSGVGTGSIGEFLFSGASGFSISAGQEIVSDILEFAVNSANDYLGTVDIAAASGNPRRLDGSGTSYFKDASATYNQLNPGGLSGLSRVYVIYKLEVASYL